MSFCMKLIFCTWLKAYVDRFESIQKSLVRHTWESQKLFPVLNPQDVKTELSYDVVFLLMGRHLCRQQNGSDFPSSLTVWLLSFDPKIFLTNQIT